MPIKKHIDANEARRQSISKAWRRYGFGRLYWKAHNRRWRWDSGIIAQAKDGTARMLFTSITAIEEIIDHGKALEAQKEQQ